MTHKTGTGKYEQVLARCKNLQPVPTAVAHPCEVTALSGAVEAASEGLITPILVGARRQNRVNRERSWDRYFRSPNRRCSSQHGGGGQSGRLGR